MPAGPPLPEMLPAALPFGRKALRALQLRCPVCWQGAMFRHPLAMHPTCPACHYRFDRGHGYFLGAMYTSYAISLILGGSLAAALLWAGVLHLAFPPTGSDLVGYAVLAAFLLVIGPLVAFPYSRVLWVWAERDGHLHDGEEDVAWLQRDAAERQGRAPHRPRLHPVPPRDPDGKAS